MSLTPRLLRESNPTNLQTVSCVQPTDARYVCERWKTTSSLAKDKVATPSLGGNYTWTKNVTLVTCPPGHLVRDYLSCDLQSQCREEHYESSCALPATGAVMLDRNAESSGGEDGVVWSASKHGGVCR